MVKHRGGELGPGRVFYARALWAQWALQRCVGLRKEMAEQEGIGYDS